MGEADEALTDACFYACLPKQDQQKMAFRLGRPGSTKNSHENYITPLAQSFPYRCGVAVHFSVVTSMFTAHSSTAAHEVLLTGTPGC